MPKLKISANKYISAPLLPIVKSIQQQIFNGKLKVVKDRGDNIRVTCPFHKGGFENKPSADIYIGDKTDKIPYGWFHCFTCDVQSPFVNFVAACFEVPFDAAKEWLINSYAEESDNAVLELPEIDINQASCKFIPETVLDTFEDFHPYMIERKLNKRVVELFNLKYDPATRSVVFPVRDEIGRLVMLTRRSVDTKMFMIDADKEKPLYLLDYIIANNIQECMITEGQLDALTACTYGFPCIATIGSISDKQIETLNRSGIRVLYLMFDNDSAGKRFKQKLLKSLRKDILAIDVPIKIAGKKDINDLTQEEFNFCVEQAEKFSTVI